MSFDVFLTDDALDDLRDIEDYLLANESGETADHVVGSIEETYLGLARFPNRGAIPDELLELGISDYRQVFFKPYRIIYEVQAERVVVYLIADGRRDMQSLLRRRLLSA